MNASLDKFENLEDSFDINNPPKGAWINSGVRNIVIGATMRSSIAFFLIPFTLVWGGFSLGTIYGAQIRSGEFDLMMSLFGIPFLGGTLFLIRFCAQSIWGKIEITMNKHGGKVFTGLGAFGSSKEFAWNEVTNVKVKTNKNAKGHLSKTIVIEGKKDVSLGTMINNTAMMYLLNSLRHIMRQVESNRL